jgi:hypothetical protein
MFWREFRKSPVALFGAGLLVLLYLAAIFADFLAPWPMTKQALGFSYHPPTPVHWFAGGKFVGPYVHATEVVDVGRNRYAADETKRVPAALVPRRRGALPPTRRDSRRRSSSSRSTSPRTSTFSAATSSGATSGRGSSTARASR